jgi:hypothetical protein
MKWLSNIGHWFVSLRHDDDISRAWRAVRGHPETVVLALGLLLRVAVYASGRSFWLDEASLWGNIVGKGFLDFSEHLKGNQLAPYGFLIVERALVPLLGESRYVGRLFPLLCGIAALVLFSRLVRGVLPRRPALSALVLFAFSDDLIYYSSELKPYSLDLVVGLVLTMAALDSLAKPVTDGRAAVLVLVAVVAPWFSFASAFVVAGCGATLIIRSFLSGRRRDAVVWATIGIGWLASFFACYHASRALLEPELLMYAFWDFAFLPVWPWPISSERLVEAARILLEIFVNPLNLVVPIWPWLGVILPVSLFFIGGASLARCFPSGCMMLISPIVLAMIASAMRRYPLHGRLILELVPAFFLLIAKGTQRIREWDATRHKLIYKAALALLLAYPCSAAFYQAMGARIREFDRVGDLHPNMFMRFRDKTISPSQKTGMSTRLPPLIADSWAQSPTMVQFAEVAASGRGGRAPLTALKKA